MNRIVMGALILGAGMAQAADLRIYPSFTEVRQPVQSAGTTLNVTLPQDTWGSVLSGSLSLEGLPFTQAVQSGQTNWLAGLEGKTVYLVRGDRAPEPVTLVRARDLLVKDAAGRFFTVRFEELQFTEAPPVNAQAPTQTLVFSLPAAGSGTLSYLTRAVSWSPRYTLQAGDGGAVLSALADIRNTTEQPYDVKATELYAGDVEVRENPQFGREIASDYVSNRVLAAPTAAPKIESQGDLRGLYRYALTTPFTLPANSVVTLPFLTPKLSTFERYVGLNTYFGTGTQDGTLNRFYRFKADQRLPGGQLTVREEGRIVGQTNISETRQGGQVEFSLGNDPDVEYTRTVQTVTQVKNAQGAVTRTTYKVIYTFESSKTRAVRAEVTERVGGRRVIIDNAAPVENQGTATLKVDVPAKGKVSKSFTVVVDNG